MLLHAKPWKPFCVLPIEPTDVITLTWYAPVIDAVCVVTAAGRRFTVNRDGTPTEIQKPTEAGA